MSVSLVSIDYASLPAALLLRAKQHCRVDFDRDDLLIADLTARAIARFERETEISIFAGQYTWMPVADDFDTNGIATVPLTPVRDFETSTGSGEIIANGGAYAIQFYTLTGGFEDGMSVALDVGYLDADAIHPGMIDLIMQLVDYNYENRSLLVAGGQVMAPNWLIEQLAGWWKPKA